MQLANIAQLEKRLNELRDTAAKEAAAGFLPQTAEYVRAAWQWNRGGAGGLDDFSRSRGLHLPALERWLEYLGLVGSGRAPAPTPDWWLEWKAVAASKSEQDVARMSMVIQASHRAEKSSPFYDAGATGLPQFTRDQQTRLSRLAHELDESHRRLPGIDEVHGTRDGPIPGTSDESDFEPSPLPGFLAGAGGDAGSDAHSTPPETRLGFAQWMTGAGRGVVARVLVNHVWDELFRRPLIDDQAAWWQPAPPPNHDLINSLASGLIDSGWSLTALLRRILLSRLWCEFEEAAATAGEAFLPRGPTESELRDAALFVSGELDGRLFGVSPRDPEALRRSLYHWRLAGEKPAAVTADFFEVRARHLAAACRQRAGAETSAQIDWLFRRLYSRPPAAAELESARRAHEAQSLEGLARQMLESDEFRELK
jgi:hypothetical protein